MLEMSFEEANEIRLERKEKSDETSNCNHISSKHSIETILSLLR